MRKDQIFVLMLVILLPLSGCIGGVGDAVADGEIIEETNNNLHILYVRGGAVSNFTTTAGEIIEILDVWSSLSVSDDTVRDYLDTIRMNFQCETHTTVQTAYGIGATSTWTDLGTDWLPSDGTSCTYEFDRTDLGDVYITYKIHEI